MIISKRKALYCVGFLALAAIGYGGWNWYEGLSWHQFEKTEDSAPQVYIEVHGPDYAYHIGDIITATVTVKQQAGTTIEWENFGLRGEFETRGSTKMEKRRTSGGGTSFRFNVTLQSLKVVANRSISVSATWLEAGGAPQSIKHEPFIVHGSNTYDGRTALQEGSLVKPSVVWMLSKSIGSLVISALLLGWIAIRSIRIHKEQLVMSEQQKAIAWLNDAWTRIENGDNSAGNYEAIELMIRQRWSIESELPEEIGGKLARIDMVPLLQEYLLLSRPAIYSNERPDSVANARLKELSLQLLIESYKFVPRPVAPTAVPAAAGADPVPTATGTDPVPASTSTDPVPPSPGTDPVPASTGTDPVPTSTGTDPVPPSTGTDPVSTSTGTDPVPPSLGTDGGQSKP